MCAFVMCACLQGSGAEARSEGRRRAEAPGPEPLCWLGARVGERRWAARDGPSPPDFLLDVCAAACPRSWDSAFRDSLSDQKAPFLLRK